MRTLLKTFWREDEGQDLVEYSLLLAFIALAAVSILNSTGANVRNIFTKMSTGLVSASTAASTGAS